MRAPRPSAGPFGAPFMDEFNPCLDCGICCTHFRISFYWAEADDAPGGFVPAEMTEKLNHTLRCMKGSNQVPRRCSALSGEVGRQVACSIYENRPTPCREFPVYFRGRYAQPEVRRAPRHHRPAAAAAESAAARGLIAGYVSPAYPPRGRPTAASTSSGPCRRKPSIWARSRTNSEPAQASEFSDTSSHFSRVRGTSSSAPRLTSRL